MLNGTAYPYDADGTACVGYLSLPATEAPCPGILIAPAFRGLAESDRETCDRLAEAGYVALGVDYYSDGKYTTDADEARQWMGELQNNRPLLATRMQAALATLREVPQCGAKVGAMGYCLGGKAVLDLARSGAAFDAGVTLHGVYDAPPQGSATMTPALLICDGWDDSLCPPEAKVALAAELTAHCADWQMLSFGHTGHAFTNPNASTGNGFGYSEPADRRSWTALLGFFNEILLG